MDQNILNFVVIFCLGLLIMSFINNNQENFATTPTSVPSSAPKPAPSPAPILPPLKLTNLHSLCPPATLNFPRCIDGKTCGKEHVTIEEDDTYGYRCTNPGMPKNKLGQCPSGYYLSLDKRNCISKLDNAKLNSDNTQFICNNNYVISLDGTECIDKNKQPNNSTLNIDKKQYFCNDGFKISLDGTQCVPDSTLTTDINSYNTQFICSKNYKLSTDKKSCIKK